jgi:ribulose-phosphate 3-epimerase
LKEIFPSIIAADWTRLSEEIKNVEDCKLNFLHLDVMDGHFVDNLTFGMFIVEAIDRITNVKLDTHLMISNPSKYFIKFGESGSDIIDIHIETGEEAFKCLEISRINNIQLGIAINPSTHPKFLEPFLEDVEQVVIMSVYPGFYGQKFIDDVIWKIDYLYEIKIRKGLKFNITIDGGVNWENLENLKKMNIDRFVMGKAFFELDFEARKKKTLNFQKS